MRLDFDVRSLNPPAPLLQATVLGKLKPVACNVMEGGSTERNVKLETALTEPQGKIKNSKKQDLFLTTQPIAR